MPFSHYSQAYLSSACLCAFVLVLFCMLLPFLGLCFGASAADIPTLVAKLDGSQGQLTPGAQAQVSIASAPSYNTIAGINRIRNVITFRLNEEHRLRLSSAFTVTLQYKVYFEDANRWVRSRASAMSDSSTRYDYVVHDCFSGGSVPSHIYTVEFFASLQRLLADEGILAVVRCIPYLSA